MTDRRVVDNRVFLLGLDELYRESVKRHERGELLRCARETAAVLCVAPADVPVEGYYAEEEPLAEYFRLVRALQRTPTERESEVINLAGFKRLRRVVESPIFGPSARGSFLLSAGEDALSVALRETFPQWTVENLTDKAYECAVNSSDFSLVALAALSRDAVVLTATRESVVLYALAVGGAAMWHEPEYVWEVDEMIQQRAAELSRPSTHCLARAFRSLVPKPPKSSGGLPASGESLAGVCESGSMTGSVPFGTTIGRSTQA